MSSLNFERSSSLARRMLRERESQVAEAQKRLEDANEERDRAGSDLANAQQALTGLQVSTRRLELDLEELTARSEAERTRHAAELEKFQGTVAEAKAEAVSLRGEVERSSARLASELDGAREAGTGTRVVRGADRGARSVGGRGHRPRGADRRARA